MRARNPVPFARLTIVLAATVLLFGAVAWRLFDISIRHHDEYADAAEANAAGLGATLVRGDIFLSDVSTGREFLVATTRRFTTVVVTPDAIDPSQRSELTETLARILDLEPSAIEEALVNESRVVLARRIEPDVADELKTADLPGVELVDEVDRSYPAGQLAADAIGFFGYTDQGRAGQYGIEASYEAELSGTSDTAAGRWGVLGNLATLVGRGDAGIQSSPHDVVLTVDRNIQTYSERLLAGLMERFQAASGTIIVQEPDTGRILALADAPTYEPDMYGSYPTDAYRIGALVPFEPGSSFKPFTMAIGLAERVIRPDTTFVDDHDIVVDGYTIKNFNEQHFGRITMTQVLEKSVNAGTMYVQSLLSQDQFLHGVEDLGFGQDSGIELPHDAPGNLDNLYSGRRINFMTASFGQGITVTPIQLVTAYSALANGGTLMRPYIVAAVRDEHGDEVRTEPEVVGTPFTTRVTDQVRDMLVSVVDNGFDKARVPRYDVAGKTGTAQIASPEGGYLEDEYNHSFVGFAPASDPRFTILIKLERPHGLTYAADTLSPAFSDLTAFLLNYLNVSPTR